MNPDQFLPLVRKPGRYSGNEFNVIRKEWDSAELCVVLAFPDLYEIGMSHQGLQILYHIINSRDDLLAERVYAPDLDLEKLLKEKGAPLFSLESQRPVSDFDMLAITLPYELCYTNILTILASSGLPFMAADRDEGHPLVFGGGPCAYHPEPVADFFDAILLGDGEEAILEIADTLITAKREGLNRARLLDLLATIEGVYVPSLFEPVYDGKECFSGVTPRKKGYDKVRRRVLPSIDNATSSPPLVPLFKIVHDRLGIEVARGCTRGCRFCQAGVIYRPVRERSPQTIMQLAKDGIESSGFEEMVLLSLSSGDYSCMAPLLTELMDTFVPQKVSVALPSMRVGTLTSEIMQQIKRVRKTGFTVAPEAGTDRLRRVINKGITEEDLLATCKSSFELGWKLIKLYFMFGLPTETDEDLAAIPALARKALAESTQNNCRVTVSASTFVPKPHTPFQWEPQLDVDEGFARIDFLKKNLGSKKIKLRWGDPRQSFLEGVMSRGDRKLSRLIIAAWNSGARFDAWSDHFRLDTWRQAAEKVEINLKNYLRRRDFDEPLPWDHLDSGLDHGFFREEYEKGLAEGYTPDCRYHGCQKCGLCDFKTVKPVVCANLDDDQKDLGGKVKSGSAQVPAVEHKHLFYKVHYQRIERARFISHLELLQLFFRTFRRAHLPLNFSQGFNPSPKVSFSPALSLGTESLAEYLFIDVPESLHDLADWQDELNSQLPHGLLVTGIEKCAQKSIPVKVETDYLVDVFRQVDSGAIDAFTATQEYFVTVIRKKKEREIDVRPQVVFLGLTNEGRISLTMKSEIGKAGIKPLEIISNVLALSKDEILQARVLKTEQRAV